MSCPSSCSFLPSLCPRMTKQEGPCWMSAGWYWTSQSPKLWFFCSFYTTQFPVLFQHKMD
jgi:hypothetical protein